MCVNECVGSHARVCVCESGRWGRGGLGGGKSHGNEDGKGLCVTFLCGRHEVVLFVAISMNATDFLHAWFANSTCHFIP